MPRTVEELLELPGVGPYAAGATASSPSEDGRRSSTESAPASTVATSDRGATCPLERPGLWKVVEGATPPKAVKAWNWAVLDLAAAVCVPRGPRCQSCPLNAHCAWSRDRLILSEDGARIRL